MPADLSDGVGNVSDFLTDDVLRLETHDQAAHLLIDGAADVGELDVALLVRLDVAIELAHRALHAFPLLTEDGSLRLRISLQLGDHLLDGIAGAAQDGELLAKGLADLLVQPAAAPAVRS